MRLVTFLIVLLLCAHSLKAEAQVGKGEWFRKAMRATTTMGHIKQSISWLAKPLGIITVCVNFYACDQVQQLLVPVISPPSASMTREYQGHVWVVDQNGVTVPIPGTWELVTRTNPNSPVTIGDRFTLPPEIPHKNLFSEGTYTDGAGILWTKVNITTPDNLHLMFLERVDTSVSPHQLHLVWRITDDHQFMPAYGEYPFEVPGHDVQVWEKQVR